jgi:phosphoribosylformimino-5-aminoimidazole carboxamide ribotide isomerase
VTVRHPVVARQVVMDLYPAIDVRGGSAVRLAQGDFAREQAYGDPVEIARRFVAGGARWLHVVDLDAARTGDPVNRGVVVALAGEVAVPVQAGGGVRTEGDVAELLGAGVARVVLGTAGVRDPDLLLRAAARHPGRVALGLDYRSGPRGTLEPAVQGWQEGSGRTVRDVLGAVAGSDLGAVVVTSIERDGMLAGPDLEGLSAVLGATDLPVVASGGVAAAADLAALARLRVAGGRRLAGVVVGKALVEGRMSMEEAIAACAPSG